MYEFDSKSYQRVWVLDRNALLDLESQGIDPFEHYAVNDLLMNDRKITAKTTPGPLKLGMDIDFQQPLTVGAKYSILVGLSSSATDSNLLKLDELTIEVPSVRDLDFSLQGEVNLGTSSKCDFEYTGTSEKGFKEYRLADSKLAEVNQDCDKSTLRELAITERDCNSFFKEPIYTCNFVATKVPQTLQSDIIVASARYSMKLESKSVVNIKALPGEVNQLTA